MPLIKPSIIVTPASIIMSKLSTIALRMPKIPFIIVGTISGSFSPSVFAKVPTS